MFFNGNWCTFLFTLFASFYLIIMIITYVLNIPQNVSKLYQYGKLVTKTEGSFTKHLDLPKSYFKHFYVISAFVYVPTILYQVISVYTLNKNVSSWFMIILNICCGPNRISTVSATHTFIVVLLMSLQVWRRFYDTHFVSIFSKSAKINFLQYILGLVFYLGALFTIISEAPKFSNSKQENNYLQLKDITLCDVIAVGIFLWAWYHQHTTTVILAKLRLNKKGSVISEDYRIPEGDWFKYLSSPHCTAEIIMYTCLTVIIPTNSSWWSVYALVLLNQLDSIISSHRWYHNRFKNFPKERMILIPFII